jgi:alkanesulfonate monooxygenase SsuD/methylene tetrahydromethanopterin reductase-like flavin-dependent oxidoreductase (luciferase family)
MERAEAPPARVKLGALLWTERTSWDELVETAAAADAAGFDSIWCSDHLVAANGDWRDPAFEAWSVLAALALATSRATIGLLVGAVGLRNPALVAKQAVTVDHISHGRFVLGLGSGWLEREYSAHGYEWIESPGARVDRLAEAVPLIRRLVRGERVDHAGTYYRLDGALQAPRPVQSDIPILIGGEGRKKTLRLVAAQADMWDARGPSDVLVELDGVLREHCAAVDRDPDEIERLANRWVVIRGSRDEAERALRDSLAQHGVEQVDVTACALGPPDEVAAALSSTVDAGFRHLVWSFRQPFDRQTIEAAAAVRAALQR